MWDGFVAAKHVKVFKEIQEAWNVRNKTTFAQKQLKIRRQFHMDKIQRRREVQVD